MNRLAVLLKTPAVTLVEFDHPAGAEHSDPDHEVSAQESISFVEDGTFEELVARRGRFAELARAQFMITDAQRSVG